MAGSAVHHAAIAPALGAPIDAGKLLRLGIEHLGGVEYAAENAKGGAVADQRLTRDSTGDQDFAIGKSGGGMEDSKVSHLARRQHKRLCISVVENRGIVGAVRGTCESRVTAGEQHRPVDG